jgi:hypothetical protein
MPMLMLTAAERTIVNSALNQGISIASAAIELAVADGLGQMPHADGLAVFQIGDRAGHPENPVMGASRQLQPLAGLFE